MDDTDMVDAPSGEGVGQALLDGVEAETGLDPRQCWMTPPALWKPMNAAYRFNLDAAADRKSHLCKAWFGPDHWVERYRDGLSGTWKIFESVRAYCNPGFSSIPPWLDKAYAETRENIELAVVMVHVHPSSEWWIDKVSLSDEVIFLTPRVQFVPPPGVPKSSNSYSNALIVYRRGPVIENGQPRMRVWRWK